MKAIFSIFLMVALSGLALSGQAPEKRFVGNCSFSGFALLSDSTYRGDIVNFTDRFGDGYNLNQLAAGYEILDGRGLVFEVDTIHSATNFTADVSVTAKVDRGFAPFGSGQAYSPTENGLIPPSSQEQAGLSPTQKARVDRHNVVVMQSLIGGRDSVYSIASVPDTSGLSPVLGDAFVNATADTLGLYDGAGWVLFFGGSQSADGFTILGTGTGGDPFRVNTDSLHTKMVSMDGPLIHYLNPCEANIDLSLSGTLFYDSIRIGDNLSGMITEDDEAAFVVVGITEWDGYATITLSASNVVPGTYFPGIYYAGELLWSDQVTVVAGSTDTVTVYLQDSILVTRVCGAEVSRDTISGSGGSLPADNITGTGTTNRIPVFAGVQELGNSYLLQSETALTLDAGKVFQFGGHTTAGRPTATAGYFGYNTTTNGFEGSDGVGWFYFPRTSLTGGLFTPGSVVFAGADGSLTEDNANLFWNNTLKRLGLGVSGTLSGRLHVTQVDGTSNAMVFFDFPQSTTTFSSTYGAMVVSNSNTTNNNFARINFADNNATAAGSMAVRITNHAADYGDYLFYTRSPGGLTEKLTILSPGQVGISTAAPTAMLHLPAGTATAGTGPLKFTSGTLLTAPEAGAVEFLTDRWYGTITTGTARKQFAFTDDINSIYVGSGTIPNGTVASVASGGTFRMRSNDGVITLGDDLAGGNRSTLRIDNDNEEVIIEGFVVRLRGREDSAENIYVTGTNVVIGDSENDYNRTKFELYDEAELIYLSADSGIIFATSDGGGSYRFPDHEPPGANYILSEGPVYDHVLDWVHPDSTGATSVGTNLATDDVPRWDGSAFQPSGITSEEDVGVGIVGAEHVRLTSGTARLFLDGNNGIAGLGDVLDTDNGTKLTVDDGTGEMSMYASQGIFIAADDQAIVFGDVLQNGSGTVLAINPGDGGLSVQPWVGNDVNDPSFVLSQIYDGSTGGNAYFRNMSVSMSGLGQVGETGSNVPYYIGFGSIGSDALEKVRTSNSYAAFFEEGVRQYALFPTADTITIDTFDFAQRHDAAIDIMVDSIGLSAGGIIVNQKSEAAYWKVDYGFFVDSDEDQIYTFWDVTTDGSEDPERLEGSASRSEISAVAGINHAGRSFIVRVPSGEGIRLCAYGNPGVTASMDISFLSITVTQVTAP